MNTSNATNIPANARALVVSGLFVLPAVAWWATRDLPAWVNMWAIAFAEFFALKLVTLVIGERPPASLLRLFAYVFLWPGMDARAFLLERGGKMPAAGYVELGGSLLKLTGGLLACAWATFHAASMPPILVGWVGMLGIIFTMHFGLLHTVSWGWRRIGVNAPPIMRAPILADSLAAFWGERWNLAFADAARRLLLRPLARSLGVNGAGALIFLVSGLVHESVISVPARGGWGGPTLYFILQAGGIAVEKSALGKRLGIGSGVKGWAWMLFCTAAPVALLFHAPFVHRVIVPFFQFLNHYFL